MMPNPLEASSRKRVLFRWQQSGIETGAIVFPNRSVRAGCVLTDCHPWFEMSAWEMCARLKAEELPLTVRIATTAHGRVVYVKAAGKVSRIPGEEVAIGVERPTRWGTYVSPPLSREADPSVFNDPVLGEAATQATALAKVLGKQDTVNRVTVQFLGALPISARHWRLMRAQWSFEPDSAQWTYSGFTCFVQRAVSGFLTAGVLLPLDHPWAGRLVDTLPTKVRTGVYNGVRTSELFSDSAWMIAFSSDGPHDAIPAHSFQALLAGKPPRGVYAAFSFMQYHAEWLAMEAHRAYMKAKGKKV